jgi:4-amino-4-deoxy-L-arabinose transferase-like glycosyltransferase
MRTSAGGTSGSLFRRLGLGGGDHDPRLVGALVAVALALYAVGYVGFPPRGPTNDDEGLYLEQTQLWVETGSFRTEKLDPLTGEAEEFVPGDYPVGMVALMAPFVSALGWQGGFVPSFLCLLVAVIFTAWWLRDEGRSPLFALILLGFPAALVAGRLAMSDAARMAATAVGLWLFFRGLDRGPGWWLASGFVAGSALTLRESAVLPFIPFFAGTVLRWDRGWGWLLLGGLAGTGLHLGLNQIAFGDPLFVRGTGTPYHLALDTVHERLPLYLLGLLLLVPGGLAFGLAYRGRRRPEVVLTIAFVFGFYLLQSYGMSASGFLKRLVVALRYFDPLLPVLALAMADAVPRLLQALAGRHAARERWMGRLAGLWVAGVLAVSFAVHPVMARWGAGQSEIREAIARTAPVDAVLITNGTALRKHIDDLARSYVTLHRDRVSPEQLRALEERHGGFLVALLDRSDSAYWREDAARNHAFIAALGDPPPDVDLRVTATDRLRIWTIGEPSP